MATVQFTIAGDKDTPTTRLARGAKVGTQGPHSALYAGDVKTAVDNVVTDTTALKAAVDNFSAAQAALKKARTALGVGLGAWDASYDILVTNGEKVCVTDDDGASLGLPVGAKAKYPFVMPISVAVTQDLKKNVVRIHVNRAPGMRSVSVETSTDPNNPASWKELDGYGAIHVIPSPPPGTLWVRAATRSASAKSDYTLPVSLIVK